MIEIAPFAALAKVQQETAATILLDSLAHVPAAWRTLGEARAEIAALQRNPEWVGFAAIEYGVLLGWIGGFARYSHAWELHPLVVARDRQREGVGGLLVRALEDAARAAGIITLYLGSDDDFGAPMRLGRICIASPAGLFATWL
jgi:aminoglycoside 6'-N-acetyltransferase I